MKMMKIAVYMLMVLFFASCNSSSTKAQNYSLTIREKHLCDSLNIDPAIVKDIRAHSDGLMIPFPNDLTKILDMDMDESKDLIKSNGLIITEKNAKSYDIVFALKDNFRRKGYSIFLLENHFNIDNQPDYIGVLKTTDQFSVLKQVGTNGINWSIDNDSLISIMKGFDKKYSFELVGASGEWCEFVINKEPTNWLDFAKDVYKVCPDVVEQGTGTVEKLAEEMKKTKRAYFWWD